MAAAKEHGRRPSRRAGIEADKPPAAEEVDSILSELEELIHSAELALAAGKHRRQGEHVCTAMCMRIQSLEGMLAPPPVAPGGSDNLRGGEDIASRGRPQIGRSPQENESDSGEESGEGRDQGAGPGDAEPRRDWSEVFNEEQRELVGGLVARLPTIVKRFAQTQRARVCDVADNLMQVTRFSILFLLILSRAFWGSFWHSTEYGVTQTLKCCLRPSVKCHAHAKMVFGEEIDR